MPTSAPDLSHLAALIAAAREEAERLGAPAAAAASRLSEAARALAGPALTGSSGHPDEGLRPDELTTENDE